MNEYKFSDLYIGLEESFSVQIDKEKIDNFRDLSGDINPLHMNKSFANNHGYKDKIVFGMLSASMISTLAGVYLPGKYCLILQTNIKFKAPVFENDILQVKGKVKELNDSVQRAAIDVLITNQNDKVVIKALLYVGFTE